MSIPLDYTVLVQNENFELGMYGCKIEFRQGLL